MTRVVTGNILEAQVDALVNTVNTKGVMGKGIALQFKKAFPDMYVEYARACKDGKVEIGKMHIYTTNSFIPPKYIINFPTKKDWKQHSRMEYIERGLVALVKAIRELKIHSIAIPPLGCGQGGLDWGDVLPRIEQALREVPEVDTLIYEPAGTPKPEKQVNRTKRPEVEGADEYDPRE